MALPAFAADPDAVVAVYSSISPDYTRVHLPDGSLKTETYAFGEGDHPGSVQEDFSIDKLRFLDVARSIAPSLAAQKYLPAKDARDANLLIMVYWGVTAGTEDTSASSAYQIASALIPPPQPPTPPPPDGKGGTAMASDPSVSGAAQQAQSAAAIKAADDSVREASLAMTSLANRQRDRQNVQNATVLGYLTEMQRVDAFKGNGLKLGREDVLNDVEESRYYVVLLAYDFPLLLQKKQRKLVWETRFSLRARHHDFSEEVAAMAQSASHYFGQDSQGLLRKPLPNTSVHLGELKVIDVEPETKK